MRGERASGASMLEVKARQHQRSPDAATATSVVRERRTGQPRRLLVVSTLYPNAAQPHNGIFVENRLRHFLQDSGHQANVIAPVPWFPFTNDAFGRYATFARVPRHAERHGIPVIHPRFPVIPKIGMSISPFFLYQAMRKAVRRLMADGHRFDLIDAHYMYPDGVAAAWLARDVGLPYVLTGRGTDLNLIPRYPVPRRLIKDAVAGADGIVTVCAALREDLVNLGIERERVTVLRNGVDLDVFQRDEEGARQLRAERGLDGPVIASVGHLIPRKGHDLVIRALAKLPGWQAIIAGTGPEDHALRRLARESGVGGRVHFLGAVPHTALKQVYSAANVLVLASSREGWPNVLLESLACGTPVVATAVNGSPEVVRESVAGRIIRDRTPTAVAEAVAGIPACPPHPADVRRYAEQFSWRATSEGQMRLFDSILGA